MPDHGFHNGSRLPSRPRSGQAPRCKKPYRQLPARLGAPLIREVLRSFRAGELTARAGAEALALSRSRFYELYADYLCACATRRSHLWLPGTSGGDHAPAWAPEIEPLLRKLLGAHPPASYSFAASEVWRRCKLPLDPATVRRFALANDLAPAKPSKKPKAPVRRWQCAKIGALWQLDATPHRWLPGAPPSPLLNMLDDCSRRRVGARIYAAENLLAYLDFLPCAFTEYGLPLELYVDYHSIFFTSTPGALTQLGHALHFYGVSFRYAPTPQAKGKIERSHQDWQNRLPAFYAAEAITDLATANSHLDDLRHHRDAHERHRELRMTPLSAWQQAAQQGRTVLRPTPHCPWWPYVFSLRTALKVGPDGRVPVGTLRLRIAASPGTRLVHCQHPNGDLSILRHPPAHHQIPQLLLHLPA